MFFITQGRKMHACFPECRYLHRMPQYWVSSLASSSQSVSTMFSILNASMRVTMNERIAKLITNWISCHRIRLPISPTISSAKRTGGDESITRGKKKYYSRNGLVLIIIVDSYSWTATWWVYAPVYAVQCWYHSRSCVCMHHLWRIVVYLSHRKVDRPYETHPASQRNDIRNERIKKKARCKSKRGIMTCKRPLTLEGGPQAFWNSLTHWIVEARQPRAQ